ncbi:putative uncharacterized protein DDB_G0290521 [Leptopilina heterotoma]|uniref:putative uncharacterized protein DDB_G0290521 n=1 Tax=Leptopilina heterotoma TaxID=63436 RepID=UPI001CAA27B1|nr:putative uncharacterized protein DDB_G0290521 [Leptopilina heterotoma]
MTNYMFVEVRNLGRCREVRERFRHIEEDEQHRRQQRNLSQQNAIIGRDKNNQNNLITENHDFNNKWFFNTTDIEIPEIVQKTASLAPDSTTPSSPVIPESPSPLASLSTSPPASPSSSPPVSPSPLHSNSPQSSPPASPSSDIYYTPK